jgi:hypothetical protein
MGLLPMQTVNSFRKISNIMVKTYGFDCKLYIPKVQVIEQRETLDIYQESPDLVKEKFEEPIDTKVFVLWKPDNKTLRSFGIFVEESLPIVAWFLNNINRLQRDSFIKVPLNTVQGGWATDEFQLVDKLVKNMYNATVIEAWSIAPRRRAD